MMLYDFTRFLVFFVELLNHVFVYLYIRDTDFWMSGFWSV